MSFRTEQSDVGEAVIPNEHEESYRSVPTVETKISRFARKDGIEGCHFEPNKVR